MKKLMIFVVAATFLASSACYATEYKFKNKSEGRAVTFSILMPAKYKTEILVPGSTERKFYTEGTAKLTEVNVSSVPAGGETKQTVGCELPPPSDDYTVYTVTASMINGILVCPKS